MCRPQIGVIRDRGVPGIEAQRRSIQEVESFGHDPGDDLRVQAAPGKGFRHAEDPSRPSHRSQHSIGVDRFGRTEIDHLNVPGFLGQLIGGLERLMQHRAGGDHGGVGAGPGDTGFADG